jgi:hypothetical protein
MALTYDVEVWLPSLNAYKEVSSEGGAVVGAVVVGIE